jgi:phage terminase large subunit
MTPEIMKRLEIWHDSPGKFVQQALGATPEKWQLKTMLDVRNNDRTAVKSGHGVGKSALLAWIILWWLLTRFPAKVACTAPTSHQLDDVLWGEISKWYRKLPEGLKSLITVTSDKVFLNAAPNESFAVARTARKEKPEAFQGFHSENMLFIVDEASGVDPIIFEVGEGSMSTEGAKTLLTGNPTRTSGYFYDAFNSMRKWWVTRTVRCSDSSQAT